MERDIRELTLEQAIADVDLAYQELEAAREANVTPQYKAPRYHWRGKGRCFSYFDQGLQPWEISPRQSGFISRATLRSYYCQWKALERIQEAKLDLVGAKVRLDRVREREEKVAAARSMSGRY